MVDESVLAQLRAFDGNAPILSAYLSVPAGLQPERAYITAFRARAQDLAARLPVEQQEQFAAEIAAAEAWLEREPPQGEGAVVFSCRPAGLWHAAFIPFPVADHLAFEALPHLTPLLDLLAEHARCGVAIVDKEQARFLTIRFGVIEEDGRFRNDVTVDDEHVGWDEGKYARQYDDRVQRHFKDVAARLDDFRAQHPFDRLILGGPQEAVTGLKGVLTPPLAERLAGTVAVDIDMAPSEVAERALAVAAQAEREREDRLVATLFERVSPGGRGISGVDGTLRAVWSAAVDTLLVAEGVRLPGGECTNCGRLDAGNVVACPACQGVARPVDDVVAWAADRTLQQSGAVEIVHGAAAARLLAEGEGLGALLRFSQDALA